ncbi:MAG: phosphoribosylanthranilate isomerase [Candidatus Omnitrophica bacterium]|nr:phosphoribosylanthranilate isomerase [Candidatus Omnitrophota bacterium]MCM8798234.1 phosphoribosylanthranilate isomerase [Candidatus Omnitrophota bacterium]
MVKVKICGITNLEDARLAINLGADALGFVFAESPRKIGPEEVLAIIKKLPPFIFTVGVFVNEDLKEIKRMVKICKLDAVQLHGEENPFFCGRVRNFTKVIKAFRIRESSDLEKMLNYDVDAYLLDTYVSGVYGGTGKTFNWDWAVKAKKVLHTRPLILSGGLNPENIKEAIKKVKPYAVDVSSGVEIAPGKKDKILLEKFIKSIKILP